jgi:hypothetical protein
LTPHKKILAFVVAGVVVLALLVLFLEIGVRRESDDSLWATPIAAFAIRLRVCELRVLALVIRSI